MEPNKLSMRVLPLEHMLDSYPLTVSPETFLRDALALMFHARVRDDSQLPLQLVCKTQSSLQERWGSLEIASRSSYVLVVEGEQILGIFTERDLVNLVSEAVDITEVKMPDIMTSPVMTVKRSQAEDAFALLTQMRKARIRHLPVLNDCGQLIGVVTQESLRRILQPKEFLKLRRVADVMVTDVVCAPVQSTLLELAQLMNSYRVSCVAIVKGKVRLGRIRTHTSETPPSLVPIGIVTERDIVQLQALGENLARVPAEKVMSAPLFLIDSQETLWNVHQQMRRRCVRRSIVASENGELIGIVTQSSFLSMLDPGEMLIEIEQLQAVLDNRTVELQRAYRELKRKCAEQERLETVLRQANRALEGRVESRTEELLGTNALLQQEIEARQRSEQLLRAIFDRALEAILILDDTGQFVDSNPAACHLFERAQEELIGLCFGKLVAPGLETNSSLPSFPTGGEQQGEVRLLRSDGQVRNTEYVAIPNFFPRRHLVILQDITERKRAELELKASEACYREVVEAQTELVIRCSPNYSITFVNEAFCRFRGKPASALLGENIFDNIICEDRQHVKANFELLSTDRPVLVTENRRTDLNGNIRWHQWTERGIFDECGQLVEIQSVARDITARKQAEEELQQQYRRSKLLAEFTRKIHQTLKLEDILQTAVSEVRDLLQADRVLIAQLQPDRLEMIVSESVGPKWPKMLDQLLPKDTSLRLYRRDTNRPEIQIDNDINKVRLEPQFKEILQRMGVKSRLVVPIYIENRLWGLLIAHHCQVTREWQSFEVELLEQFADPIGIAISQAQLLGNLEHLVAERTSDLLQSNRALEKEIEERKQVEKELRRSREQLRLITDALPILIAYVDRSSHYRFVNKAYELWFGSSCLEIVGSHLRDFLAENSYRQLQPHVERVLSGKRVTCEQELINLEGSKRWVNVTYIPHISQTGKVKGFFSMMDDISDRKQTERMKDDFISVVSHELRTPLTSIHGSIKLLATGQLGTFSEDGQQMLEVADENCDRLVRLVGDILDLQRMDTARIQLHKQSCDVAELVRKATGAMQGMALEHEISLIATVDSFSVMADPDAIVQTLTNLLSNAIKFSSSGSSVWLTACHQKDDVLFQVKDEGDGIPADQLEIIFQRFHQVDATDSRKKGGTGLGLAICHSIVKLHGGRIWAESCLGKGSTFSFSLPGGRAVDEF